MEYTFIYRIVNVDEVLVNGYEIKVIPYINIYILESDNVL